MPCFRSASCFSYHANCTSPFLCSNIVPCSMAKRGEGLSGKEKQERCWKALSATIFSPGNYLFMSTEVPFFIFTKCAFVLLPSLDLPRLGTGSLVVCIHMYKEVSYHPSMIRPSVSPPRNHSFTAGIDPCRSEIYLEAAHWNLRGIVPSLSSVFTSSRCGCRLKFGVHDTQRGNPEQKPASQKN